MLLYYVPVALPRSYLRFPALIIPCPLLVTRPTRHVAPRHGMARHGTARHDAARHDTTQGALSWDSFGADILEVLAAVREAVAASEARQLEAIAASEGVDEQWVAARIAEVRRELAEVQEDAVMGYELVNTKHETFKRQMFQMDLASLRGL